MVGRLAVMMNLRLAAVVKCLLGVLAAACSGGGGGEKTPVATGQPTRASSPVTTRAPQQTPSIDIREVDLEALPEVQATLEENGGLYVQENVIYGDVTNDGFDDAVVPISSGGTLGSLGFFVFSLNGAEPKMLLSEFPDSAPGLAVAIEGEKVVLTQPVPGPDDPECCPSLLQKTVFAWNGAALALEGVSTEPNPDAGGKGTPAATP